MIRRNAARGLAIAILAAVPTATMATAYAESSKGHMVLGNQVGCPERSEISFGGQRIKTTPGASYELEGTDVLTHDADFDIEFFDADGVFIEGHYQSGGAQDGWVPAGATIGVVCLSETDTAKAIGSIQGVPAPILATFTYTEAST
jgi:hypothetical protein